MRGHVVFAISFALCMAALAVAAIFGLAGPLDLVLVAVVFVIGFVIAKFARSYGSRSGARN